MAALKGQHSQEIHNLNKTIEDLNNSLEELKKNHNIEIESLRSSAGQGLVNNHETEIAELKAQHEAEIAQLKASLMAASDKEATLSTEIEKLRSLHDELKNSLEESLQNKLDASVIDELNTRHAQELEELNARHAQEIEELKLLHEKSRVELEEEIEKINSNHHQSIKDLRDSHSKEMQEFEEVMKVKENLLLEIETLDKVKNEDSNIINELHNQVAALNKQIGDYEEQLQVNVFYY